MNKSEFTPIAIYHFSRWNETKIPVYISLSNDHFVKVFNSDETYSLDQLNKYIEKGIKYLYIKTNDENIFLSGYDHSSVFKAGKKDSKESYDCIKENHNFLNAQVSSLGLTKQSVRLAQHTAELIINDLKKENKLYNLLERALNSKDFSYDHSYLTICISSFLCAELKIDQINLRKISTAALLHDLLLLNNKITYIHDIEPEKIKELSSEEKRSIQEHHKIENELDSLDQFGSDITDIINFHHSGETKYPYPAKKDLSQLSNLQVIFQASHFVSCEIYKSEFDFKKIGNLLTLSKYKYSGKNFDKIWHTMQYIFNNKLN